MFCLEVWTSGDTKTFGVTQTTSVSQGHKGFAVTDVCRFVLVLECGRYRYYSPQGKGFPSGSVTALKGKVSWRSGAKDDRKVTPQTKLAQEIYWEGKPQQSGCLWLVRSSRELKRPGFLGVGWGGEQNFLGGLGIEEFCGLIWAFFPLYRGAWLLSCLDGLRTVITAIREGGEGETWLLELLSGSWPLVPQVIRPSLQCGPWMEPGGQRSPGQGLHGVSEHCREGQACCLSGHEELTEGFGKFILGKRLNTAGRAWWVILAGAWKPAH